MAFEHTWRWFGPLDPVTLDDARQAGATGIVTALHHVPIGEVWPVDEIEKRQALIRSSGLRWSVAESISVHESIKTRTGSYRTHISNYMRSIEHLGRCGVNTVCFNFMPVLDWSRTDLHTRTETGSVVTSFTESSFAAFDLFLLCRPEAAKDYSPSTLRDAKRYFADLSENDRESLVHTVLLGFPGSGETYTLEGLQRALRSYDGIDSARLREHLALFLQEVVPVAEKSGVFLAVHPDDPPWPLLGLPRAVSSSSDLRALLAAVDSPSNGLTFCSGSLGAGRHNNVAALAEEFSSRVNFVHLRNVRTYGTHGFVESDHLDGDVDMISVITSLVREQRRRTSAGDRRPVLPMRPDHGALMRVDEGRAEFYPGYSLLGRLRGLAEIRGVELAVERTLSTL